LHTLRYWPKLREIDLSGTQVSDAAIEQLSVALPNLKVVR
jgi:hypothetical protein